MNDTKKLFLKQNKTDFSLRQGAIKSAQDCGLKNKKVIDCCEFQDDIYLKDIDSFTGSLKYYPLLNSNITEGVKYIVNNGYSWLVTDMLVVIRMLPTIKNQEFLSIKLKMIDNEKAVATIDDGNGNILYTQHYRYTSARVNLNLFYTNKVLLLAGEY